MKKDNPKYCSECWYCSINCRKQELANNISKLS